MQPRRRPVDLPVEFTERPPPPAVLQRDRVGVPLRLFTKEVADRHVSRRANSV
jgi:hypothetical protein